jgi:hypothetical protein
MSQNNDYEPVKVIVAGVDGGIQDRLLPSAVRRERVIVTNSWQMSINNPPVQILSHSPKRCYATIIFSANGTAQTVLGTSQSDVQDAISSGTTGAVGAVVYITYNTKQALYIPVEGNTELWAGSIADGVGGHTVSVIKTYDT